MTKSNEILFKFELSKHHFIKIKKNLNEKIEIESLSRSMYILQIKVRQNKLVF